MQNQIDQMLYIDKSISIKAQALCEKLISQNFHDFFDAVIIKINQLSQSLPHISPNYDKSEYEVLKRLVLILNRELRTIMRDLPKDEQQQKLPQIWTVINQLLMHPDLNFAVFKKMLPSIAAFLSFCDEKEVNNIFESNKANNKNPEAQVALLMALFQSKLPKKTICKITIKLFHQFEESFISHLQQLLERLENMDEEEEAIEMVCKLVKRWTKYMEILLKNLQMSKQSSDCLDKMLQSRTLFKTMQVFLQIDNYLLLKKRSKRNDNRKNTQQKDMDFRIFLKSKYGKINKRINLLKAATFKIINFFLETFCQSSNKNQTLNNWRKLVQFLSTQLIEDVISDIYILGKYPLQDYIENLLTVHSFELFNQLTLFISNISQIRVFRKTINQAIDHTASKIEFIFFACICNIERFEEKHITGQKSLLQDNLTRKISKNHHFFVSNFMLTLLPLMNLQIQDIIDYATEISKFFLNDSASLSDIDQKLTISQSIENRIQQQNLSIYLHLLDTSTKQFYLKNYQRKPSQNLLEVIQLIAYEFEKFSLTVKTQLLSLCLNVSHSWRQKRPTQSITKLLEFMGPYLNSQDESAKLFLDFCYSAILHLAFEDIELAKVRGKKNSQLVLHFFRSLAKCLKSIQINRKHYAYNILSCLVVNDIWNQDRSAFDGNFIVLQICYHKVLTLDRFLSNHPSLEKDQIQELTPSQDFLGLVANCILSLQLSFNSQDDQMQHKMHDMRNMAIEMIHVFSRFTKNFTQNQIANLCQIFQIITGTPLQDNVSPELRYALTKDYNLLTQIARCLDCIKEIGRGYLQCISNLVIIFENDFPVPFLLSVFKKVKKYICGAQNCIDNEILKEILDFVNLVSLYHISGKFSRQMEIKYLIELWREILRVTAKNQGILSLKNERKSQRLTINSQDYTKLQIKLLQMRFFICSAIQNSQSFGQKMYCMEINHIGKQQNKLLRLVVEFMQLKKQMSLSDLTFIVCALEKFIHCEREQIQKELILEVGLKFLSLKKQMQISLYLKTIFQPIKIIVCMIEHVRRRFMNSFSEENLKMMQEIMKELKSFELSTPAPRKIISLRKQRSFKSIQQLYNQYSDGYGEDIQI